jgi:hypothetical protein
MEQSRSAGPGLRRILAAGAAALACLPPAAMADDSLYQLTRRPSAADSVHALGNYYFFDASQSTLGPIVGGLLAGFRASTGVVGFGQPMSVLGNPHDSAQNLPYFSLGYSHLWFHSQLSLNADFGLATQAGVGFGRVRGLFGTLPMLEETSDPRWAPVMAVNVRYSF